MAANGFEWKNRIQLAGPDRWDEVYDDIYREKAVSPSLNV